MIVTIDMPLWCCAYAFCCASSISSYSNVGSFCVAHRRPSSRGCSQIIGVKLRPGRRVRRSFKLVASTEGITSSSSTSADAEPKPDAELVGRPDGFKKIRKALASLASLGVIETIYLSAAKFFASPAAICRTRGCVDVLSGPYSSFLGIPISAFGIIAYATFAFLAAWPLFAHPEEAVLSDDGSTAMRSAEDVYRIRDAITRPLLLATSTVMLVFSSYFMFLLSVVIRDSCPYCIFSAVLSTTLFIVTAFVGRAVRKPVSALKIGGVTAILSTLGAAAVFMLSSPGGLLAQLPSEPQRPPEVTTTSDARTLKIGRNLKQRHTKMYGAYWCNHCYDQKQRLGKKAFSNVEYIECDRGGVNTQYKLCRQKKIPGYPTWEIDGELYPGELQMDDLEKLAKGEARPSSREK